MRPKEARRHKGDAGWIAWALEPRLKVYRAISGLIRVRAGLLSPTQHTPHPLPTKPAADKIEVEMKLDAPKDLPATTGWGWCSARQLLPPQPPLALSLARPEGEATGREGAPPPRKGPSLEATDH